MKVAIIIFIVIGASLAISFATFIALCYLDPKEVKANTGVCEFLSILWPFGLIIIIIMLIGNVCDAIKTNILDKSESSTKHQFYYGERVLVYVGSDKNATPGKVVDIQSAKLGWITVEISEDGATKRRRTFNESRIIPIE